MKLESEYSKEISEKIIKMLFVSSSETEPNKCLGLGERILFFISFYSYQPIIAASWLAFKLVSKWQTWNTIIKFPEGKLLSDFHKDLEIRNRYGTNVLQRWLIGTLLNLLLGFGAYIMAVFLKKILCAFFDK